ncbi:hypothetical protein BDQ17DRAFT_261832 [Cyathus striatus]|nr:hypothetical protein BDQ17DRAFT_261832 [Cyathus striatus]
MASTTLDAQPKLPSSAFSFKAPFPTSSALKQRRVSLALPADSPRVVEAWSFRDDTGIDASSSSSSVSPVEQKKPKKGKIEKEESDAAGDGKEKKPRKKWSQEETQMLVDGCNRHGVGNWKTILSDPTLKFDNRSPVDLKDRFRTYFPDAYKQHYPNARTHLSSKIRSTLPDGSSLFEKTRSKRRRPFTEEEDRALKAGYEKHGTVWAAIVKDPVFAEQNRRSTDLRDRFRNAFPELYQAAGYKPRSGAKYRASSGCGPAKVEEGDLGLEKAPAAPGRGRKRSATDDAEVGLGLTSTSGSFGIGPVRSSRRRAATSQGLLRGGTKSVPQSTACSEDEDSDNADGEFKVPHVPLKVKIGAGRRGSRSPVKKAATIAAPVITPAQTATPSPPAKAAVTVAMDANGVPYLPLPDEDDEMELVTPADEDFLSASPLGTGTSPTNTSADTPMSEQGEQQDQWERRAETPTHSSPFVASPSGMGNNMIGKSAWGAQDWFSPNPRLGADSSSASSCSFDGDDTLSQSHSQSLESLSPGGLSPSSPFAMHHHLNHGVMDRYDLFPSSISLSLSALGAGGGNTPRPNLALERRTARSQTRCSRHPVAHFAGSRTIQTMPVI